MTPRQTGSTRKVRSDAGVQTFCFYCQKEFGEMPKLQTHLRRSHKDTYAQHSIAPMKGHPA